MMQDEPTVIGLDPKSKLKKQLSFRSRPSEVEEESLVTLTLLPPNEIWSVTLVRRLVSGARYPVKCKDPGASECAHIRSGWQRFILQ